MIKISPSILAADFADMGRCVENAEKWGADFIHCDVMDGAFVPNISFGPEMIRAVRRHTSLPLDVHLMVERPERYAEEFVHAGADYVTIHAEASPHAHRTLNYIRTLGAKAGIVYNPGTGLDSLDYLLDSVDMVLLMTVNPGFGGQKFIPEILPKIRLAAKKIGDRPILLEVDGGINAQNAPLVTAAGANVLVAGSSVFRADDPAAAMAAMRN